MANTTIVLVHLFSIQHSLLEALVKLRAVFPHEVYVHEVVLASSRNGKHALHDPWWVNARKLFKKFAQLKRIVQLPHNNETEICSCHAMHRS